MLTGSTVTLRELRLSDAPSLLAMLTTEEVARFISPPPTTVEGFERFIAWTHRERAAGNYVCFAVVPHGMDTAVGIFQVRAARAWLRHRRMGLRASARRSGARASSSTAPKLVVRLRVRVARAHRLEARAAVRERPRQRRAAEDWRACRKASCGSRSCATANISTRCCGRSSTTTGAPSNRWNARFRRSGRRFTERSDSVNTESNEKGRLLRGGPFFMACRPWRLDAARRSTTRSTNRDRGGHPGDRRARERAGCGTPSRPNRSRTRPYRATPLRDARRAERAVRHATGTGPLRRDCP